MRALLIIALLISWFLPLIIGALYKLPHQGSIAVLSLLLGWTGVGWLAALVIAVGGAIRATRPSLDNQAQPQGPGALAPDYSAPGTAPAQPREPVRARWPTPAQPPAQPPAPEDPPAPGRVQPAERSVPSWPDNLP